MRKPKPFYRVFTESGPLIALAVAIAMLVGIAGPASAQFFNFGGGWSRPAPPRSGGGGGGGGGWFGGDFFAPFQQPEQPKRMQDFSKAPAPEKRDPSVMPEPHVLVLGDGLADWLALGPGDACWGAPPLG